MSQRFLITGGAGFIGSALVRRLIKATSHHVLVVDKLTYAGSLTSLASVAGESRFAFVQEDICNEAAMQAILQGYAPDIVIHLAAESHVDRSIHGPDDFIKTNINGTASLLNAALAYWRALSDHRRAAFRFHHVSTDEVFGSLGATGTFSETTPYDPHSPYSASKAASDHLVRAWHHTYGLPIVISHSSNNYGPYQFPEKLIPIMILNGLEGKKMPIYGNGEHVRDWLFVEDHIDALLLVAQQGRIGETYCIGGNNERSNTHVVNAICTLLDEMAPDGKIGRRDSLITFVADRPGHDQRYALNSSKAAQELGWHPKENFESGLIKTIRWYLDHESWWQGIRANINRTTDPA